jgi:hypothetical protein
MKLRYLSDLHLEFIKPHKIDKFIKQIPINDCNEICILAGDIGNPYQSNYDIFMNFISKSFKKSFVIAGNHEYYNKTKTFDETNIHLTNYFKQFNNISFLNNTYVYETINNTKYCFIGSTLWSKIINPYYKINDVYNIPNFDYIKYNELNQKSIDFLNKTLNEPLNNCIMITHHMPSESLIDTKYNTSTMLPYQQWFYSDLDELIEKNKDKIKCWIYGHTHTPYNGSIHGITFLCNPIGYPNENHKINFQMNIII